MLFFQFFVILISYNLLLVINILTSVNAAFNVSPGYPANSSFFLAEFWKKLEIQCIITPDPPKENVTVTWLKDGQKLNPSERIKINHNKVTILRADESDVGDFQCQVQEPNSSSVKNATIAVKFKPYIWIQDKDQTVIEEMTLNITCNVKGKISEIKWRFENDSNHPVEKKVTYYEADGVKNAQMQIKSVNKTDRGYYYCFYEYEGSKSEEIRTYVRIKGKYAALWPFLGICAEVLILCTIIFIYEKRRDKTELEESDTDQGPETKSSPDHGTDSVRHRK